MSHKHLMPRFSPNRSVVAVLVAVAAWCLAATPGWAIDWSTVTERDVPLFYPGQGSWEWALTQADHSGAKKFREGKNCRACHGGEEQDIGEKIVTGKKLESSPIPGKPGSLTLKVKTAHDGERLYLRLAWRGAKSGSGKKMDDQVAARVTLMVDDGRVKEATRAGCWGGCHDDAVGMAAAQAGQEVTKYLTASRTKMTRRGGEAVKPAGDLAALITQGAYLEYWQARLNPGQPAQAVDGYVLDKRHQQKTPAVSAQATFSDGEWVVVLSRKLRLGEPGHKDLFPDKTYTVGFAVHDDYANHRFHHVSFEHTLALDRGPADLVAVKQ
jgi:cytochrome c-type protein NapC